MNGLAPSVTPDKLLCKLVRSAILSGHTDREINEIVRKYVPKVNMELVNTKIDERV